MSLELVQEALLRHFTPEQVKHRRLNKETRVALGALDFEFFCRYYLPHHFNAEPSEFHRTLFQDADEMMSNPESQAYLAVVHRGGAKTTIYALAWPLWCICFQKRHFIINISESERMAKEKNIAIKAELETNERLRNDFGDLVGKRWAEIEFETVTRIKVLALGSGMNIRGAKHYQHRPDLIILDDIESKGEVSSPTQRRRLWDWFRGDVLSAGQPNTKFVVIGTYLSYDCVLKQMEASPFFWRRRNYPAIKHRGDGFAFATNQELWDQWTEIMNDLSIEDREAKAEAFYKANEEAMLEGAECNWPERFPYYTLMRHRLAGRAAFNTEYLNEPSDPDSRFFARFAYYRRMSVWNGVPGTWLVPWGKGGPSGVQPARLEDCALFAATDPSMGQSVQADYSAILILAYDPATSYRYVVEADLQRRSPNQIIVDQNAWYQKYPNILRWTIETVQMQAFFKQQSGEQSLHSTRGLPLVDYKTGSTSKHVRIQSLQAPLENGYIMLSQEGQDLLKEQLERYPHTTHDDGPDALEMAYVISLDYQVDRAPAVTEGQRYQFGNEEPVDNMDPYAYADYLAEERERYEERKEDPNRPAYLIVL